MTERSYVTVDGNEAVACVAYQTSEVIALYPITPAAPMGELVDQWSTAGRKNVFGIVPRVVQMQGEGGVAGAIHGALQAGALATTFTASQGLLLMIPDMYRIAGTLMPAVIHVAARTVATHATSIGADHSDVMAVRQTGWAIVASASVQEAQDLALIAHIATLDSRVPFVHFFDGFRTSHEINKIELIPPETMARMIDEDRVREHRLRALDPDRPVVRGTGQDREVFFQTREAANSHYGRVAATVQATMDRLAEQVDRTYHLFDYVGDPAAERVLVLMGSAAGAAEEAVEKLCQGGEKVGLVKVRLYRPFDVNAFNRALPATAQRIAVLDRTKEPGAVGEPLYQDVVAALAESGRRTPQSTPPDVSGGRYGLSSKDFTPAMAAAVFAELAQDKPQRHFTIGILDDVTRLSLRWDPQFSTEADDVLRAVFFAPGQDGTVAANKLTLEIIGQHTPFFAQGYFAYDLRKVDSMTVSHLRFSPRPIRSTYLIEQANFVECHDVHWLERFDVLDLAAHGATFLLISSHPPHEAWERLPRRSQRHIIDKNLRFYVVDAHRVAEKAGLGENIGTVVQACFFWLSNVLPHAQAVEQIKHAIQQTFAKRGRSVVDRHVAALDAALDSFQAVPVPQEPANEMPQLWFAPEASPDFARQVTDPLLVGKGDELPVSVFAADGTYPTGTGAGGPRSMATQIPVWDPATCTECGLCSLVCPHSAIRIKAYPPSNAEVRPKGFKSRTCSSPDLQGLLLTIQVVPDDCTGCGICVDVCPAKNKEVARLKAINMSSAGEHAVVERAHFSFFRTIPSLDRGRIHVETALGSQLLEPLFGASSACAGCGETPYVKLLSQLFGDRLIIANATGCSSTYCGQLPSIPWGKDIRGRGPAWASSLFEDNAEFGLGMRLAIRQKQHLAARFLRELGDDIDPGLAQGLSEASQERETEIEEQRCRVATLVERLSQIEGPLAKDLSAIADSLVRRSVWIVGGDGWACDIGFAGLDHVLASGEDVNLLVLDTGLYSSTGGQVSKSTPRSAVAKFASAGKVLKRKDLGRVALTYNDVYVAQVAMGADPGQTIRAFLEAESYRGPSLILAYCHCIAHGVNMSTAMTHQKQLVKCGLWPLYRRDPRRASRGERAFQLDCDKPQVPFRAFAMTEARFAILARTNPDHARQLFDVAQQDVNDQWEEFQRLAGK